MRGLEATVSTMTPPSENTREAGMVTPELYGPSTKRTFLSTSACATCTPWRGSATSSLTSSSKITGLPPIFTPLALSSLMANAAPSRLSVP